MTIEPCTSVEQPGWLDLRVALWPDYPREQLHAGMDTMLADPERFFQLMAYDDGGSAIGFVEASLRRDYVNGTDTSPVVFLEGIYVAPERRRLGIAKELVARVAEWGHSLGCTEFASDALLDNLLSHEVHKALGFEEADRVVYFRRTLQKPAGPPS
jgi:aminoglycoside 6'-N-acetyltransferase I